MHFSNIVAHRAALEICFSWNFGNFLGNPQRTTSFH